MSLTEAPLVGLHHVSGFRVSCLRHSMSLSCGVNILTLVCLKQPQAVRKMPRGKLAGSVPVVLSSSTECGEATK